jgi:hypothetical protein
MIQFRRVARCSSFWSWVVWNWTTARGKNKNPGTVFFAGERWSFGPGREDDSRPLDLGSNPRHLRRGDCVTCRLYAAEGVQDEVGVEGFSRGKTTKAGN